MLLLVHFEGKGISLYCTSYSKSYCFQTRILRAPVKYNGRGSKERRGEEGKRILELCVMRGCERRLDAGRLDPRAGIVRLGVPGCKG